MLILLLVLGALVGALLGLVALSSFMQVSVTGLPEAHSTRPRRERRGHEHPDLSKREERYPKVPPPLAPMSQTPAIPLGWGDRVLAPASSLFVAPVVPTATASSSGAAPAPAPAASPAPVAPAAPVFTAFQPAPPPLPAAKPRKTQAAKVVADAASAVAGDAELVRLLEQGHFIAAIKRYRDEHGVGLEEAKAALTAWRARSGRNEKVAQVVAQVASDTVTDPQIVAAIRKGNVIEAIKLYRAKTGVSLQDAKEAIDEWRRHLGR